MIGLLSGMQCRDALSPVFRFRVICRTTVHILLPSFLHRHCHASSIVYTAGNAYNRISRDFTIIISVCPFVKHIGTVFQFLS